jgi:hypothetical protein
MPANSVTKNSIFLAETVGDKNKAFHVGGYWDASACLGIDCARSHHPIGTAGDVDLAPAGRVGRGRVRGLVREEAAFD